MVPPHGYESAGKSQVHSAQEQSTPPSAKARRVITSQACGKCREERVECDGQQPCRRCQNHENIECVYDTTPRRSNEELRVELQKSRDRQDDFDVAEPGISDQFLGHLHTRHSLGTVLSWAEEAGESKNTSNTASESDLPDVFDLASHKAGFGGRAGWDGTSSGATDGSSYAQPLAISGHELQQPSRPNKPESIPGDSTTFTGLEDTLWPLGPPDTAAAPQKWTSVTSDPIRIHHLMALYFCWEYPLFTSLSREHFMNDFHHGYHRFCSPLLVNAMLALGSCWDGQSNLQSKLTELNTHGDRFFEESLRLLGEGTTRRSLSTVQALALMAMREINRGRGVEGRYYSTQSIRLAIDLGLHRKVDTDDWDLHYVQRLTFWGAFSLDTLLSIVAGSLPQYPFSSPRPPIPSVPFSIEQASWLPYTGEILPQPHPNQQTSNIRSIYSWLCGLADRIYQTLYTLYSPVCDLTAMAVLNIYTTYLSWYDQMPEALRLGFNSTPSVLVSHMCYHFAIIHLFNPFLDLQLVGTKLSPVHICHQAADAIQSLLKSYSQLHTLDRTPVLVPIFTMASAISHLEKRIIALPAPGPDSDTDTDMVAVSGVSHYVQDELSRDISDLRVMSGCHYSAAQAVGFLRAHAKERKIEVDIDEAMISTEDYDRLARPYLKRISLETREITIEEVAVS